jgi:hypothetical protein
VRDRAQQARDVGAARDVIAELDQAELRAIVEHQGVRGTDGVPRDSGSADARDRAQRGIERDGHALRAVGQRADEGRRGAEPPRKLGREHPLAEVRDAAERRRELFHHQRDVGAVRIATTRRSRDVHRREARAGEHLPTGEIVVREG